MTDRVVTVPDSLEIPADVKVPSARLSDSTAAGRALLDAADAAAQRTALGLGTAATTPATDYATAAQGAKADAGDVAQITLTGNLALTIPEGHPAGQVYRCAITQTTGGHTVTYGGDPVAVGTAAGASTLVEVWPGGTLVYPGAASAPVAVLVWDEETAAYPTRGTSVMAIWRGPADPATIAGSGFVADVDLWAQNTMGETPIDSTAPTVPANLTATATSSTTIALAWDASTDAVGVTGYNYRVDAGAAVDAGAGTTETVTGLTAETLYSFEVQAYDAAGNLSGWSTAATETTDPEYVYAPALAANVVAAWDPAAPGGTDGIIEDTVNAEDLTIVGGATVTAGSPAYIQLDGTDDYLRRTLTSAVADGADFTSSVWLNMAVVWAEGVAFALSDFGSQQSTVLRTLTARFYYDTYKADGVTKGAALATPASPALLVNTWYHVILVRRSLRFLDIYLNGVLAATGSGDSSVVHNAFTDVLIGATYNAAAVKQQKVGEVVLFNKALDAAEATAQFNVAAARYGKATI